MNIGIQFEQECIERLKLLGFENVMGTPINDYGADIVAFYNNDKYIFQCKYHKRKQGVSSIQEVLAAKLYYDAHKCVVISHTGFTKQAYNLAAPNCVILLDSPKLFSSKNIADLLEGIIAKTDYVECENTTILSSYEKIKTKLGRTPTLSDLDKTLRYKINRYYKNYTTFLLSIGDSKHRCKPSNEQLKSEYLRIRNLLGKTPSSKEIKYWALIPYNSFHQYPLTQLQKECGDIPLCDRSVSKEELIQEYLELKKQLGHFPTGKEIDKLGKHKSHQYRRKFGSLEQFYKLPQINVPQKSTLTSLEIEVIYTLLDLCLELKHENLSYQVLRELSQGRKKILTTNQIEYRFGSFSKFNENLKSKHHSTRLKKQLMEIIQLYINRTL